MRKSWQVSLPSELGSLRQSAPVLCRHSPSQMKISRSVCGRKPSIVLFVIFAIGWFRGLEFWVAGASALLSQRFLANLAGPAAYVVQAHLRQTSHLGCDEAADL